MSILETYILYVRRQTMIEYDRIDVRFKEEDNKFGNMVLRLF